MKNDYTVFEPDLDLCVAFDEAIECLPRELDLLEIAAFFKGLLDKQHATEQQREIVASLLVPDLIPPMH